MADVLVVDDDVDTCRVLGRLLRARGHAPSCCPNGAVALAHLASHVPALVLLDVMMPGLSGIDVLRQIRRDERPTRVAVVLYTAAADPNLTRDGRLAGAADVVPKTGGWEVLYSRLEPYLA
jgi:CheY-like chemotaxis protein